jgi:hypothetical protein
MCVLNFSTTFVWYISHSKKNWYDMNKNVHRSSCKVPVILVRFLIKLEFLRQMLEKYSNIKFYENPSSGSRVVCSVRTDGHDETNSRFSHFCELAQKCMAVWPTLKENCCNEDSWQNWLKSRNWVKGEGMQIHVAFSHVKLCTKVDPDHTHKYIRTVVYVNNYKHGDDANMRLYTKNIKK